MARIRGHPKLFGSLGALFAALALTLAILPAQLPAPLTHESARAAWARQALRHYSMEVAAQTDNVNLHLLLEVRDERFLGGVNLRTGAQLTPNDLAPYLIWLPVDRLFDWIELQRYVDNTWQRRVADLAPWAAQQLGWCYAQSLRASYDPQLGYPATVHFRKNVCSPHDGLEVHISITPLPN
jgi:hypothetical protein